MKIKNLQESFFNKYTDDFSEYVERMNDKNIYSRKDYVEIMSEIDKLKDEQPNVRIFLDECKFVPLTEKEHKTVIKIRDLENNAEFLVQKEIFKLGFREAYIFFNEMGLLK